MMKQLRKDDARAVDLLLENGLAASRDGAIARLDDATVSRVAVAESVLRVFGEMPAGEPSNDLVARTLSYVYAGSLSTGSLGDAQFNR
jgi:hypothetical protein